MDKVYRPSPKQIETVTLRIQAGWSPRERRRRRVGPQHAWRVPTAHLADIIERMVEAEQEQQEPYANAPR